jgi:aerobic-type carbon monoxide dehydrogenase small subunit (CoxS/CutS family)
LSFDRISNKVSLKEQGEGMKENIQFKVNGKAVSLTVDSERMLLWVLRTELGLTGTKYACGEGLCGACTVLVDGEAVRSCQYPMKNVRSREVTTIEGLAADGKLHPLQEAFVRHNAMQCGFCTSGMILNAYGLLRKNPRPTREQIIQGMDDNFCRCGSHTRVIQAIESAAQATRKGEKR